MRAAPDDIKGFSPPFVGALQEPGVVQIWSGLVARTAPGWSLLVRGPANLPRSLGYEVYEGSSRPTAGSARCSPTSASPAPTCRSTPSCPSCRFSR